MIQSSNIELLAKALSLAQSESLIAKKDSQNPFFKSSYADLSSVWNCARSPLTKNGLSVSQIIESDGNLVSVTTILLHQSGQFIGGTFSKKPQKLDVQADGSLITYLRRYAFQAITGISAEGDDNDGEGAVDRTAPQQPQAGTYQPRTLGR